MTDLASVYEVLREKIVTGELAPGAPLVETTLAKTLGVSRTPIREALRRLEQDGLIERLHRGLHVRRRTPAEILDIFEVRMALEGLAARAAAERHTELDRIRIQGQLARMREHSDADPQTLSALNHDFHTTIWQASHNSVLIDVLERLALHLIGYGETSYHAAGRPRAALEEHAAVVDAILERDADRAAEAASRHMVVARTIRLEMWQRDPESMLM